MLMLEAQDNQFMLSEGTKYACVATHIPFLDLEAAIQLSPHMAIHPTFAAELPSHWHEWLGTTLTEKLRGRNFIILATHPSTKPEVLDGEHSDLARKANQYLQAIMLFGAYVSDSPMLLKGSQVSGELSVRQVGDLNGLRKHGDYPYAAITPQKLEAAYEVSMRLDQINTSLQTWKRFRKGVLALMQASSEASTGERTHHWVRALEALLMTDQGRATRQFRDRCQLFTGFGAAFEKLFSDAYNTRSFIEHMNDLESLQVPPETFDEMRKRVDWQSCELEIIALEVYKRILSSDTLTAQFMSDSSTRAFWSLDISQKGKIWGEPIDTVAIRNDRNREVEMLWP